MTEHLRKATAWFGALGLLLFGYYAGSQHALTKKTEIVLHRGSPTIDGGLECVLEVQNPDAIFIGRIYPESANPRTVFSSADKYLDPLLPETRALEERQIQEIMYPPPDWEKKD